MYQGLSYEIAAVMPEAIATGLFVSLCTIQQPSGTFDAGGAPDGLYVDVDGLQDIPCTAPPSSKKMAIASNEKKTMPQVEAFNFLHVLLSGYYPTILQSWRAVVDGDSFDIIGTEHDSQMQMTRLMVRVVTV